MKIIEPSYEILTTIMGNELKMIELAGRTCYKSEDKITDESAGIFVENLIRRGHESVLEHSSLTVKFICDRGISHELVRHRIASFSQESTRYCNYTQDKFDEGITFIKPSKFELGTDEYRFWLESMEMAECYYNILIGIGASPEMARSVLPNSLKTEIVMTANYREWRHFFKLRLLDIGGRSHPDMKILSAKLLEELVKRIPFVFDDILFQYKQNI